MYPGNGAFQPGIDPGPYVTDEYDGAHVADKGRSNVGLFRNRVHGLAEFGIFDLMWSAKEVFEVIHYFRKGNSRDERIRVRRLSGAFGQSSK